MMDFCCRTIIECTSKPNVAQPRRTLGQPPPPEPPVDPATGHVPRVMIKRGLACDLAKVPHYIDLGSKDMAETINATLKPLEAGFKACHALKCFMMYHRLKLGFWCLAHY